MERDAQLPLVRDFMTSAPKALREDDPIDEALAALESGGWTGAPVVDASGALVGVVSEVDGVRVLASAGFHTMPPGTVADHMTRDVRSARPDEDLYAVANRMVTGGIRRLVVREGARIVGLITLADVGRALRRVQAERDRVHRATKPAGAAWDPRASEARDRQRG